MELLECLILTLAVPAFLVALAIVAYDLYIAVLYRTATPPSAIRVPIRIRKRTSIAIVVIAWIPLLVALSLIGLRCAHTVVRAS